MSWPTSKLVLLTDKIGSGATPKGGANVYLVDGDISLIRSQNVLNGQFAWDGLAYIDPDAASKLSSVEVFTKDVLLNITGDSVARSCIVDDGALPARVNQHVAIIRVKQSKLDPRFLLYYLVSPRMQQHMLGLAASGATRNALTKGMIENFDIPCPDMSVQQNIAEILSSLDEKIELNRKQNRTLEAIAQALFKRWFVEFEFPDENGRPYQSSGGAMQPSELGEIPVGWEVVPLSDVTTYLNRGITPAYVEEGGVAVLNQRCVRDGWINTEPARRHDAETRKIDGRELQTGDVLVNSTGMGTLGRVAQAVILNGLVVVDSHITVVRADSSKVSPEYLGVCLRLKEREIEHMAEGSTGQTELSRAKLGDLPVVVPDNGVLRLFTEVVADLNSKRALNWSESLSLARARDTLLPKLMSGELRVA